MKKENRKINSYDVFIVSTMILAVLLTISFLLTPLGIGIVNDYTFTTLSMVFTFINGLIVGLPTLLFVLVIVFLILSEIGFCGCDGGDSIKNSKFNNKFR